MDALDSNADETKTLELLGRIRDGDGEAWDDLYRLYHDDLLFTIRARLGQRLRGALQSEDIFQSVAIEAFKALPQFESRHRGSLRHFLRRLVINKIRDRADTFGAKKRAGGVPLTDSLAARAVDYHDVHRYEKLEKALERMPEDMREVVVLRKLEGYSSKEVAEILGREDAATRKLLSRAMARLTALMMEEEE